MIGQVVSHYRVIEQIGAGGMGVVYRAEDTRLGRPLVLKFLPAALSRDPMALERFEREAKAASSMNHPGICTVYDIGEFEGQQYIAMEYLEGQPLDRFIGHKPLPLSVMLDLGVQITDAIELAHTQGILHRDIKPANIFITRRGHAKVLDFGLAKLAADGSGASALDATAQTVGAQLLTTVGHGGRHRGLHVARAGARRGFGHQDRTCSRWVSCCTRWPRDARRFRARPPRWCSTRSSTERRRPLFP